MLKHQHKLYIDIPKPCSQDWNTMVGSDSVKHCSHCDNIIYDFSQMSDEELYYFFKQKPGTHCGRFHNSQLRRDIFPLGKPYNLVLSRFNKVAAAVFTLLSFKNISSKAQDKNIKPAITFDSAYAKHPQRGISTISGSIREYKGGPLENARVMMGGKEMAVTDKDGKFSFDLEQINLEIQEPDYSSQNIYFSYGNLITAVRTYHYAMFSAGYDVTLFKESTGSFSMGIMIPPDYYLIEGLPSLAFKSNSAKLSDDTKGLLSSTAKKLKEHAGVNIMLQSYPAKHGNMILANSRMKNIKKYLIEEEGISADRIKTNFKPGGGKIDIIDIVVAKDN